MRGCRTARTRLLAASDRELALEERFRLDAHLARCAQCAAEERRLLALDELLEGAHDRPSPAADLGAARRAVFAALERGEPRTRPRALPRALSSARAPRMAVVASGCAALLLGLWFAARDVERPARARTALAAATVPAALAWTEDEVERAVREALMDVIPQDDRVAAEAGERFLAALREPARAGWPVRRFVEAELEHPDTGVAVRAARCLGVLGESGSLPALERALWREGVAPAAIAALGDLGEPAVASLERALAEPALAQRSLHALCRVGGARAAGVLERRIRSSGVQSVPSREALLDALTSTGRAAAESLLRLAESEPAPAARDAILARLLFVAGAGEELDLVLRRGRIEPDVAYRSVALLQPPGGLAWLEERCGEHRERARAFEALAEYSGSGPLDVALRLTSKGRVPRDEVLVLVARLVQHEPASAELFTDELIGRGDPVVLRDWLLLLLDGEHPDAAPALALLAGCERVADDDRQWAALAVGEIGRATDAARLLDLLARAGSGDRRLAAACLISAHALAGSEGVERFVGGLGAAGQRRVLSVLEQRGRGEAVLVHRVARALEAAAADTAPTDDGNEIL